MKKFLIIVVIFGFLIILIKFIRDKVESRKIIAPYYDAQVFIRPTDSKKHNIAYTGLSVKGQMKIPIIMYHYVEYVKDIGDFIRKRLSINPYVFESQLKSLNENHYTTYFVKDIPDILDGKTNYSTQSAVLTFDDGYEDFYTDVFPLLKKYQIKATVYIICDFIGRKGFLNAQEIKELAASDLVEIGDHTMDHYYLKNSLIKTADQQIIYCKNELENNYGITIKTFAYPYGAFSPETIELVKQLGFTAAVSVISGTEQSNENLFYLSRIRAGQFSGTNMISVLEKTTK